MSIDFTLLQHLLQALQVRPLLLLQALLLKQLLPPQPALLKQALLHILPLHPT